MKSLLCLMHCHARSARQRPTFVHKAVSWCWRPLACHPSCAAVFYNGRQGQDAHDSVAAVAPSLQPLDPESPRHLVSRACACAVLRDSAKEVVIKVLKPGVEDVLATDLDFLWVTSRVLELVSPGLARTSLAGIVSDIRQGPRAGACPVAPGWRGAPSTCGGPLKDRPRVLRDMSAASR